MWRFPSKQFQIKRFQVKFQVKFPKFKAVGCHVGLLNIFLATFEVASTLKESETSQHFFGPISGWDILLTVNWNFAKSRLSSWASFVNEAVMEFLSGMKFSQCPSFRVWISKSFPGNIKKYQRQCTCHLDCRGLLVVQGTGSKSITRWSRWGRGIPHATFSNSKYFCGSTRKGS